MKKLYFIPLFLIFSCTAIKQLSNEKVEQKKECSSITFEKKTPLLTVKLDQVETSFLFDTGAGLSVLLDSTIIPNFNEKKFGYLGSAKGANRKKIKNRFLTVNLKTALFESENKVLTFINMPKSYCSKSKKTYTGILGMDLFFDQNLSMQLDFTNNKICNISAEELQLITNSNYYIIKSECKRSQIFIFLTIEGKEYKFKLDTGFIGTISIPKTDDVNFTNTNKIELDGNLFATISGITNGTEILYEKMPVTIGNENVETKITVSSTIKAQNIGIDFIKGFDWVIDYNNNKIYIKRNSNTIDNTFSRKVSYYSKAQNENKLLIIVKEKSQSKYNLGDEITSVNNQKVTPENICEMQDLLNKTEDWNTLNLEVIPAVK
jgi:predicted aspartyl protease